MPLFGSTWVNSTPFNAPASAGVLDGYALYAAIGLFLIKGDYSGPVVRVKELGGGTEADIGVLGTELDEASIASHCLTNLGRPTIFYDQSGNARDFTQTTAGSQGLIYDGAAVVKQGGKPAVQQQSSTTYYAYSTAGIKSQPTSVLAVYTTLASGNSSIFDSLIQGANRHSVGMEAANGCIAFAGAYLSEGVAHYNDRMIQMDVFNGASSIVYRNGASVASGNAGTQGVDRMCFMNATILGNTAPAYAECLIVFEGNESANVADIFTKVNDSRGVY